MGNSQSDHINSQSDHINSQSDHINSQSDHINSQSDHINSQSDHINFQEVLRSYIETTLRSSEVEPRPVFAQLYLDDDTLTDDHDEDHDEDPQTSLSRPPEGRISGFCQAGQDVRLSSLLSDPPQVPAGFSLVGLKSFPETLMCAVDRRFLPDQRGRHALPGFSGNCVGCGERIQYFSDFCGHMNLKDDGSKQKLLKFLLQRDHQGALVRGSNICWTHGARVKSRLSSLSERLVTSEHTPGSAQVSEVLHLQTSQNQVKLQSRPGRVKTAAPLTTAGPPKKRHKGWSPDGQQDPLKSPPSSSRTSLTTASRGGAGETSGGSSPVQVPEQLLLTCGLQPVVFKGHGTFPELRGNVSEVLVTSVLQTCFMSLQTLPRFYQDSGPPAIRPLSAEMQILLTVHYLVQLGPDQVPLIPDLEQILMRSWRESHLSRVRHFQSRPENSGVPPPHHSLPPHSQQVVTPAQLPWLAQLAVSSSGGAVVVLAEQSPLAQLLQQTLVRLKDGDFMDTSFIVILAAPPAQELQSCVLVAGRRQCRALAEDMLRSEVEVALQLCSPASQELLHCCSALGQDGDMDSLLDEVMVDSRDSSSSSSPSSNQEKILKHTSSCRSSQQRSESPRDCPEYSVQWQEVRPVQLAVARKLLSHVCAIADSSSQNLDLGSFDRVSFLILVPPSEVTFQQTLLRLHTSGVLQELGNEDQDSQQEAEKFVVKMDLRARARIDGFVQEAQSNSYTLYILVHDHAHWDTSSLGLVDQLLNSRQVRDTPNILILHVTSFPFALQTQSTRISPYNEVHWPSAFSNDVDLYHEKTHYFGVSELLESSRSAVGLPLMRCDSSFEQMATSLEDKFPQLHSTVIRTTVLVQHYCVALMVASGRVHDVQDLHQHTSVETLEMVQSLLSAAQHCPAHHGHMLLLRIPSSALAAWAHRRLSRFRRQLGLEDTFEIVLGNPGHAPSVGARFINQIKVWLKIQDADWTPRTYLELEALPCILILSGAEPLGESLPRSLKFCDLRVISCSYLHRTRLEQELGLAAYLVRPESRPQHSSRPGSDVLESDGEKLSSSDNEEEELHVSPRSLSAEDPLVLHRRTNQTHLQEQQNSVQHRPRHSKSSSSDSSSRASSPSQTCSWARGVIRPPSLLLPRSLYDIITASDGSGLPRCTSFLPHKSVSWTSSFRPLLSNMMTCTEQSLYYRQWTVPGPQHMDSNNRTEGRSDNFHPRRLLLSGPPQVGKTGAYLHFLGILSRMLIRLMEVDIYDEEEMKRPVTAQVRFDPANPAWPDADVMRSTTFDYTVHDPKYDDISAVFCPEFRPGPRATSARHEDVFLRRHTTRIKLSKYAAYNTYHHCEQCHAYLGFNPGYQMYESSLHTFAFTHLLLGEEIQLYFIIPESKKHHFSFSQSGGRLESLRLPLTSDQNSDTIKTPIFTPTTGRHEHGLFNLFHAMDGASHLHILVVKEYEVAVYKKYWPNHILLVLPTGFNGAGIGAAHFLIKELSYNNLELERGRRAEGGGATADVWPFVIIADDSCVMWNAADEESASGVSERAVSLKQILQHMETYPDLTRYGLCGLRKWSSRGLAGVKQADSFSRGHLHDFLLLNVDRSQNVQYDQNRFTCHDVDFTLRLHSAGLLVCRFNRFSLMKKQIPIGGFTTFIIKTKVTDVPTSVGPPQYVCAPDSKHLFLATPPQLLLEKYLQHTSYKLFPLSTNNYTQPVLSVDCYLNLGPEVSLCFVSSRPHSVNINTSHMTFSGLLLCFPDSFVTPCFLKSFSFMQGATLCVISSDRSSLRQTLVRLELEDKWRFRLSDEFQTANAKEDRPLFFLTGKHI